MRGGAGGRRAAPHDGTRVESLNGPSRRDQGKGEGTSDCVPEGESLRPELGMADGAPDEEMLGDKLGTHTGVTVRESLGAKHRDNG